MRTDQPLRQLVLAAAFLALGTAPAPAAMEPDPVDVLTEQNPDFARGRQAVAAKDWNAAIQAFSAAAKRDARNANIQNMLAYSYRSAGQLDLAFKHYQRALQIDPQHRGAHEYIGEAYLMAGNPAKAEEHLAALKRVCPSACEERDELARRIAEYRSRSK